MHDGCPTSLNKREKGSTDGANQIDIKLSQGMGVRFATRPNATGVTPVACNSRNICGKLSALNP